MKVFRSLFENRCQKYSVYKEPCDLKEKRNNLNFQDLLELGTLKINAIWRMLYLFWSCLNTTVCEFNSFIIGTVNAVQKKFV